MKTPALTRKSIDIIDAYWATSFGYPVEVLRPPRTVVVPHAAHVGFQGVYAMTFGAHPIVSLPPARMTELQATLARWTSETIGDSGGARASLRDRAGDAIGPAWLGYADAGSLRMPEPSAAARLFDTRDAPAVDALRASCTQLEWEHGGSLLGDDPVAGVFDDGVLAAVAGYETWGGTIAHIAVVANPAYRGRGLARAAVATIARHALANGLVPQYRTLESNEASRRIADSLGFVHVATSLAVRLKF